MRDLEDFLRLGVAWAGVVPASQSGTRQAKPAADALTERSVVVVLLHLARVVRADRPFAAIVLPRPLLSGGLYRKSTVTAVLSTLQSAGLLRRERRERRGSEHEELAATYLNPALVEFAREWSQARRSNFSQGLRGAAALPARCRVDIPLGFPVPRASQALARAAPAQRPNSGRTSGQILATEFIHTPLEGKGAPRAPEALALQQRQTSGSQPQAGGAVRLFLVTGCARRASGPLEKESKK
jgi:hypothetical protein